MPVVVLALDDDRLLVDVLELVDALELDDDELLVLLQAVSVSPATSAAVSVVIFFMVIPPK
jgi:hypothetical protein